jgi:homoserine dehydrogenase
LNTPLRIGIAGLGTVGVGLLELLNEHGDLLTQRCGRAVEVTAVSARDRRRDRGVDLSAYRWHDNALDMASDPDVDVVVELIGGSEGVARELVEASFANAKSVVTANKALIAHHGAELAMAAEKAGAALAFEAAVAGGIPIVKALREGLAGNDLSRVYGILNGTCNYILTQMEETKRDFAEVLDEAQEMGYAEADPSFDIDGVDAAHKIAILTSVAFGCPVDFDSVYIEGIRHISAQDIAYAAELGYRIKLLAITQAFSGGVEQRVHPCMVPLNTPIAHVDGVFNAVVAQGDFVGQTVYEGRGAGAGPTASAVAADLVDIARDLRMPAFAVPAAAMITLPTLAMDDHVGPVYVRLTVIDQAGVMADVSAILRDENVSIETMLQRGRAPGEVVSVVLILHDATEAAMRRVLAAIEKLEPVVETPRMIRIELL